MKTEEILQELNAAAQVASHWSEVASQLRKIELDADENPFVPFIHAFSYRYIEHSEIEERSRWGIYGPMAEFTNGQVFPLPLDQVSNETIQSWKMAYTQTDCAVVKARLGDLLWLRKINDRPDLFARGAIDAYIKLSEADWNDLYRAFSLIRAFELARAIRDNDLEKVVTDKLILLCGQLLDTENPKPGVTLRLIRPLLNLPLDQQPDELDDLIENSFEIYKDDPWILESLIGIKIQQISEQEQRIKLRISQVQMWIDKAEASEGIAKFAHYQHALEIARNYGLTDLANEIRQVIQKTEREDLDLKEISVPIRIPTEEIERYIESFIDKKAWRVSLSRFGFHGPPSGDYLNNLASINQQMREHPLPFIFPQTIYDENNYPIMVADNEDENKNMALVRQEMMGILMFGKFAPQILNRIIDENGKLNKDELVEYFTTTLIQTEIADNIAQAINWYFKGEYDICVHLLLPRIETVFRTITREVGIAIFREPVGDIPGRVLTLGKLLDKLKDRMDESWRRYFVNLLVNPIGINLRNRICHGLTDQATQSEAALLIHTVCYLRHMEIGQPQSQKNT